MSDAPYGGHPPAPAPWPPQGPPPAGKQSRWPLLLTTIIALIAIGIAIASWFRPVQTVEAAPDQPRYSEQEVSDAKKAVCDALATADAATAGAGSQKPEDWNGRFTAAVNIRLAFHAAGNYLSEALNLHPATPRGLADTTRQLAASYYDIVLAQIALEPSEKLEPIYSRMDSAGAAARRLCT